MINLVKNQNFIYIVISLFPLALITGPLIPEIIMFLIILIFFFEIIKERKIKIFKNFVFLYFFIFFAYLIIISFYSEYKNEILLKNIFIFRYLIFVVAVLYFLKKKSISLSYIFKILTLIFLFLIVDGLYQFYHSTNIFGYPKIRPDRISSIFNDKFVLGSFLSKFIFIYMALFFHLKTKKNIFNIKVFYLLITLTFIIILLSGDRSALFLTIIGFSLLLVLSNIEIKKKLFIILIFTIFLGSLVVFNKNIYDRYINQTTAQFQILSKNSSNNFFEKFKYYDLIWNTSHKAYLDKKITGHGPKSFRYFCSDKKYETLSKNISFIRNDVQLFEVHKKIVNSKIIKIFVNSGDFIKKDSILFQYEFNNEVFEYKSNRIGKVEELFINKSDIINPGHKILSINLKNYNIPEKSFFFKNGCTNHPHQIYLQLLSETGLIGFLFIFLIFLYISYLFIRFLVYRFFKKIIIYNNVELILLVNLFIVLFPLTTSGNFFNNWYVMIHLIQISILLYIFNLRKIKN